MYLLVLASGIFLIWSASIRDLFMFVNTNHTGFQDAVMPYVTYLGDGLFLALVALVLLLFVTIRAGLALGLAGVFCMLVVQLFKQVVIPDSIRPTVLYSDLELHLIEGVTVHQYGSFPSGHTATAFATFAFLAFGFRNNFITPLLIILAILVGYSRVYLAQHFVHDTVVGSFVGVACALVAYWLVIERTGQLNRFSWSDRSLVGYLRDRRRVPVEKSNFIS